MTEIDISRDLLAQHVESLRAVAILATRYGNDDWALVGGLMVLVLGREASANSRRAEGTKDADIIVDVVTRPALLANMANALIHFGYKVDEPVGDDRRAARCSFVSFRSQIDLLCPDGAEEDSLYAGDGVVSIPIPGGRRALETARPVELYFHDEQANVKVRIPSLAGGLMVKAAAALDPRTSLSARHVQDVAFLLSCAGDLEQLCAQLTQQDIEDLATLHEHALTTRETWRWMDASQQARAKAAWRFIISKRR